MTLDDLPFPFYVVSNTADLDTMDLSFAYHAFIRDGKARAMCNDISCQVCPFTCKQGENRQEVLLDFAKSQFPEMLI